jgi:hypothetical protein
MRSSSEEEPALTNELLPSQLLNHNNVYNSNRFASIASSDDDDSSKEEDNEDDDDDLEEAGDQPVLNHPPQGMDLRRLIIRICTSQSDLWAYKASSFVHDRQWSLGAEALQCSIAKIQQALELADAQISKWYAEEEDENGSRQQELMQDADIVHVAVQSLIRQRDDYRAAALRQTASLQRQLEPQWKSRDEVKERWGEERWANNARPKHDFSKQRRESEHELRQLLQALEALTLADNLQATAGLLKTRLQHSSTKNRYNGQRPTMNQWRVAFPDAAEYGWTFTGSADNVVEFFEKEFLDDDSVLVKLDFYFTTGTVKTSMYHPSQGKKTQLFCKEGITRELYIEILENPRVHTNIRYHTKNEKPQRKEPTVQE